jgi:amino acid transporter
VPYNAARDGVFFRAFGRLHPRGDFPHVALIVLGVITAVGSLLTLTTIISMLTAVIVIIQAVAQIVALTVLRRREPGRRRPFRQWLYPLPSLAALAGWAYVYSSAGRVPVELSVAWVAAGVVAFLVWARVTGVWPFGPRRFREDRPATQP